MEQTLLATTEWNSARKASLSSRNFSSRGAVAPLVSSHGVWARNQSRSCAEVVSRSRPGRSLTSVFAKVSIATGPSSSGKRVAVFLIYTE